VDAALEIAIAASTGWAERRPVPDEPPTEILARFRDALPDAPRALDEVLARVRDDVLPLSAYNGHPRWFAYITASPLPAGVAGDFLASALNQNLGLWRISPAATAVELQTLGWITDLVGLPAGTEGVFVSGGQMANIVAHAVLRDAKTPWDMRRYGARGLDGNAPQLRVYASAEVHYCHEQAAELLGLGREAVRLVSVDECYRIRLDALRAMIADDRARGDLPIAVVATAGTVGTGAVDPLPQLVELAREEGLWLHVDGAYGAFAALAASAPPELRALAAADSIACDPHKWLFAPIDAGVTLVRQPGLLARSFAFHASYLETSESDDRVDMIERTPENTRPFRALKVWVALQALGRDGYAALIERNIALARRMEERVRATPGLRLAAPRELSIVCWRAEPEGVANADLDDLQTRVIAELEARGIAMVSNARLLDGSTAIRSCIVNFRTSEDDVDATVDASAAIAAELA
jgi:glutamate/tyrosine decarboxylase-like PLP-dependent enzyme